MHILPNKHQKLKVTHSKKTGNERGGDPTFSRELCPSCHSDYWTCNFRIMTQFISVKSHLVYSTFVWQALKSADSFRLLSFLKHQSVFYLLRSLGPHRCWNTVRHLWPIHTWFVVNSNIHVCFFFFFKSKIPIQVDALTPGFNHTVSKLKVLFATAVIKVQQWIHQVPYLFLYHCNFWQVCFPTLSKLYVKCHTLHRQAHMISPRMSL